MSGPSQHLSGIDLLEQVFALIAQLDRKHLDQLHLHLADLMELLPTTQVSCPLNTQSANGKTRTPAQRLSARSRFKQCPPGEILERQQKQAESLIGKYGGGFIEWKWIRQNGKLYGPYPYWRFNCGTKRCSIYLKQLAREMRQRRSSGSSAKPKATNA